MIVSLGIGHAGASQKAPSQDVVLSHLWTPRHLDLRISPLLPSQPPRDFGPLTNINFGGLGLAFLGL